VKEKANYPKKKNNNNNNKRLSSSWPSAGRQKGSSQDIHDIFRDKIPLKAKLRGKPFFVYFNPMFINRKSMITI